MNNTKGLPIKETFFSIQGEGLHLSIPDYSIRFEGCTRRFDWCDKKKVGILNKMIFNLLVK